VQFKWAKIKACKRGTEGGHGNMGEFGRGGLPNSTRGVGEKKKPSIETQGNRGGVCQSWEGLGKNGKARGGPNPSTRGFLGKIEKHP